AALAKQKPGGQDTSSFEKQERTFATAESFLKKHLPLFTPSSSSLDFVDDRINLEKSHPFFRELSIDWNKNQATLRLHEDLIASPKEVQQAIQQLLVNEVASIAHQTQETLLPTEDGYAIALQEMEDMTGVLTLDLKALAQHQVDLFRQIL